MVVEPEVQQLSIKEKAPEKKKKKKQKEEEKKKKKKKKYGLVTYEELPGYMKENEYILGYYRAEWPILNALLSLFSWHNETLNVWTHLLGFFLFLGLTLLHLRHHVPQVADLLGYLPFWSITTTAVENISSSLLSGAASSIKLEATISSPTSATPSIQLPTARWPFFIFLGGSMFCLLSSTFCHLFCCHSHRLNLFLARFDYVGIAVMIVASFFPPIYYIFQCDPHWQLTYLATITVMGFVTVFSLLSPHLSTGKFRSYRALLFSGMGFFGIVPAVHAAIVNWSDPRRNITLAYELAMALSYVIGTIFYVSRVPERWKPGQFDLAGQSHQIFHVFVIAGALAHYGAALILLEHRDEVGCGGVV